MKDIHHHVRSTAAKLLKSFLIQYPSSEQIKIAESFISKVICDGQFVISPKLTFQEQKCLFLAANGMSIQESAKALRLSKKSVQNYRTRITSKLKCNNIAHAVYEGIRYGYLSPNSICCNDAEETIRKEKMKKISKHR